LALVSQWEMGPHGERLGGQTFRYDEYVYLRDRTVAFSGLAAETTLAAHELHGHEFIESPAVADMVTGNFFDVLGVRPFAGRAFTPADDVRSDASHVAVASYRFASRRYPLPQDAVGKTVYLQNIPFIIVGVMAPGFFGTEKGRDPDLYVPIVAARELVTGVSFDAGAIVQPIGRMQPGVDLARAQSNLQLLWRQLLAADPAVTGIIYGEAKHSSNDRIVCESGARGYQGTGGEQQRSLRLLGAIVAVLLLIGCANVACLLVARGAARQHETAIRLALGAGRALILRQSFLESGVLALAGGAGALAVAVFGCRLLVVAFHWQKRPIEVTPDARVLAFTLAVSALSAVLFGLAPAIQLLRGGRVPLTQEHSVAPFSSGKVLVSIEVALSLVLLAGAAVFIRSFQNLRAVPVGFVAENVSVVRIEPKYDDEDKLPLQEVMPLVDSLRGSAGIQSATLANFVVFNDGRVMTSVRALDDPKIVNANDLRVAPGYWETLRIPLIAGRGFTPRDDEHSPKVAVLSETAAARLFPNRNPLGQRILMARATREHKPGDEIAVVGVAKDTRFNTVAAPPPSLVYLPILQRPGGWYNRGAALEVRSPLAPAAVGAMVDALVRNAHLPLKVSPATAFTEEIGATLEDDYIRMQASSLFAALALALIAFGLYGLMAYTVARRTREIGIRAAMGASTGRIVILILRQSVRLVAIGIVIGIPGAVAAIRALSGIVFGLPPVDLVSLSAAAALLAAVGAAASFVPAWRAAHLSPVQALRVQ
jgi:predicted permease